MDFDEYEYLEKMVEGSEGEKSKATVNGGDESGKSRDRERRRSSKHRSEDYDDLDHRDKRSKNGDDAHHSDRHKEKGLSSHRSRSSDVDRSERERDRHRSSKEHRDRDKEKDEKNGKEHDRDRRRDRDRDRSDREREKKEKVREPDQDRDKERELEHDRDRRSRSQSGRHRDDREPSRDRDFKERDFKSRDNRHRKDKKDEASEPEADPERDQRTVFAFQLPLRADERDIYEFFSRAGKVRDVRLIMDRNSRRSKGVGYIEFYDVMSVPMAIALSGQPLLGHPIMVKPSEAEKNLAQSTSTAAGTVGASAGGGRKLYVGNLHYNITEEQLRQVFESFGAVELVQMPLDETGHCKGFGFVQFSRLEDAKAAQTLNGQLEIAGRTIKVSAVTDQAGGAQDGSKSAGDLDDDEGGGLSLNAQSRALLMAKLDRSGTATSLTGSMGPGIVNDPGASASVLGVSSMVSPLAAPLMQGSVPILGGLASMPVPPVTMPTMDTIGVPSECLMLNNMFDPSLEAEPDFDLDIKEDVQNECAKFGALKHIYVDKNSAGHVYLRFDSAQAAIKAQSALHGRWFAGKMITAVFMVPQNYEAKFPESG